MRLLGVDPFAEPPFRSYLGPGDQSQAPAAAFLRDFMVTPNTVLLSTASRRGMGWPPATRITIASGTQQTSLDPGRAAGAGR